MARGSIRRRGQTWTVVVDIGRDPTTRKRRQKSQGGFRTKTKANRWLTATLGQIHQGGYVAPTRQLIGDYLPEWLAAVRSSLRPATYESYERNIRQHLIPKVGHVWLDQLTPDRLAAVYAELHRTGRLDGAGGLSPRSIRYLNTILGKALGDAMAEGKLARNIAQDKLVQRRLPRHAKPEMRTWSAAELAAFLNQLRGDPLHAPILLAATTGMRTVGFTDYCHSWSSAFVYTAGAITRLVIPPAGLLTDPGQAIRIGIGLLGPVLLGPALLALRSRVKR
jgi:hypothetical protein